MTPKSLFFGLTVSGGNSLAETFEIVVACRSRVSAKKLLCHQCQISCWINGAKERNENIIPVIIRVLAAVLTATKTQNLFFLSIMVGVTRIERAASASRTQRSTTELHPERV